MGEKEGRRKKRLAFLPDLLGNNSFIESGPRVALPSLSTMWPEKGKKPLHLGYSHTPKPMPRLVEKKEKRRGKI